MAELPDTADVPGDMRSELKAKILLVDDNPANLLSLRAILDELGQTLIEARSGDEALRQVRSAEFAVVLLDVLMPGLSGFETAKLIRRDNRAQHTPIIFLTASDVDRSQVEEGYSLGAVDFIVKPLLSVVLKAKVRGFVELFRAKQQARHEDNQLRLLIEGAKDYAIFLLDPHGIVASWNVGAERIKQYQSEEIVGQHFARFYPQEAIDRNWPAQELQIAKTAGRSEDEGWRVRKDGTQFWANVVITALRDDRGNLIGFSKITREMTERKRAEENARHLAVEAAARQLAEQHADLIQEQREQLRVTLASIGDAVITTDAAGRITFVNPVAENLVGWNSEDVIGQSLTSVFRIVNESTRQAVENPALRALQDGMIVGLANHTILISKEGTERPINDSAAPIRDADGNVVGCVLVFRDVTEQRRAEQQLRASESRKGAILETALDCIITIDHKGEVIEFNPAAEKTFGFNRDQVIGQELCQLIIPPVLRDRHRHGLAHYLATGEGPVIGKRLELPALRADGSEFLTELAITRIPTDGPPLFTAYLRDVTGRKRAEQHRNLRLAVTHALNEAVTVEDGSHAILRAVCENLGWDVGFFWKVNEDGECLVCRSGWHRPDATLTEFETESWNRTFQKGLGLPGRVWATSKPAWISDVANDDNFPRIAFAARSGLHSAFACPIIVGADSLGVIEFFTNRTLETDPDLLETMGTVAGSFSQFIERKVAEDELRESEAELSDFFDHATVGLHWVGPDGTILRVNQAELEMLGYSRGEYVGRRINEFHADEDVICDILARLQAGEKLAQYPARLRCKDGSIKDVLIDSSVLFKDGKFVHTRCFTRDVTERKLNEERFRQLADAMPQIVWTAGPEGNIDYLNRRWHEFTGFPESSGNEGWAKIIHPDDARSAQERWALSLQTGAPFEMEIRLLDRHRQTYRWHLMRTVAVSDTQGKVTRWFGSSTEIHEQKRQEESSRYLAEASAALASVVDYESTLQKIANLAVPYFADWSAVDVANDDGSLRRLGVAHQDADKIRLVQQLMQEYPPDPASAGGALAVLRAGKPEIVRDISDEMLVQGAKDERHLAMIRSLGLKSYICVPLFVAGNPFGVLTFATAESGRSYADADLALAMDLARRAAVAIENNQLYQALRDTDRRKDEFLATLAHELRNPLAPIRNSLQILKMPRIDAETVERSRETMERQVHHLVRLVDDLLDVSRVMRGKIELRKEPIELTTVIARAVETAQPLIDSQSHQLSVDVPSESLPIHADPVRLTQIVGNLLTNAAKYTPPNGHVWLTAQREGGMAMLTIRDNGIGIAEHMLPRIFELFVQVDHATTRSQGGLGIGLTLAKNLVEMHNGTLDAGSKGLGQGSEFVMRLPLTDKAVGQEQRQDLDATAHEPTSRTGHRLLVVDDNQDAANTLAMLLRLRGHEVRVVYSGVAALEMAKEYLPNALFLDIGMPGMDGYEVARRMRQQPGLEGVLLAALTGWGQQEDRRRTAEAGFDHHLVKPLDLAELERLLDGLKR